MRGRPFRRWKELRQLRKEYPDIDKRRVKLTFKDCHYDDVKCRFSLNRTIMMGCRNILDRGNRGTGYYHPYASQGRNTRCNGRYEEPDNSGPHISRCDSVHTNSNLLGTKRQSLRRESLPNRSESYQKGGPPETARDASYSRSYQDVPNVEETVSEHHRTSKIQGDYACAYAPAHSPVLLALESKHNGRYEEPDNSGPHISRCDSVHTNSNLLGTKRQSLRRESLPNRSESYQKGGPPETARDASYSRSYQDVPNVEETVSEHHRTSKIQGDYACAYAPAHSPVLLALESKHNGRYEEPDNSGPHISRCDSVHTNSNLLGTKRQSLRRESLPNRSESYRDYACARSPAHSPVLLVLESEHPIDKVFLLEKGGPPETARDASYSRSYQYYVGTSMWARGTPLRCSSADGDRIYCDPQDKSFFRCKQRSSFFERNGLSSCPASPRSKSPNPSRKNFSQTRIVVNSASSSLTSAFDSGENKFGSLLTLPRHDTMRSSSRSAAPTRESDQYLRPCSSHSCAESLYRDPSPTTEEKGKTLFAYVLYLNGRH